MIDLFTEPFSLIRCHVDREYISGSVHDETVQKGAVHGQLYTVDAIEFTSSYSTVYLTEFPNVPFNPLAFENTYAMENKRDN